MFPFLKQEYKILLPCGQCLPCRINRRRKWTARILLENKYHTHSCFITLTYSPESLPENGHLVKKHLQDFFKRLRRRLEPKKIRYFACGEYGSLRGRPHYHAIIFGLPPTLDTWELIERSWGYGRIDIGTCEKDSIQYVAGYVAKKFNSDTLHKFKDGSLPREFILASRRPAIGAVALDDLAKIAFSQSPFDVLTYFQYGSQKYPLDRLMREKLRNLTMSDDYLNSLKEAQREVMRENLLDMIVEELGEEEAKIFDSVDLTLDRYSYFKEKCHEIAQKANRYKHYSEVSAIESKYQKFSQRKDL